MREEKVTVKINKKTGVIEFDCNGFIGEGCNVISDIENNLGQVTTSTMKDEAYQYRLEDTIPVNL